MHWKYSHDLVFYWIFGVPVWEKDAWLWNSSEWFIKINSTNYFGTKFKYYLEIITFTFKSFLNAVYLTR